jgi:hypothetical protein
LTYPAFLIFNFLERRKTMPMDFPDFDSLIRAAEVHKFRMPNLDEPMSYYREKLHKHVLPIDRIEAFEILFGVGWDKWTDEQKKQSLYGGRIG